MSGARRLTILRGSSPLNLTQGLLVLPDSGGGDVRVGVESVFTEPLYWRLPGTFLGDRTSSYNGLLRFRVRSNGRRPLAPREVRDFPLVQLQGNGRVVLEHFPGKPSSDGSREVRQDDEQTYTLAIVQ